MECVITAFLLAARPKRGRIRVHKENGVKRALIVRYITYLLYVAYLAREILT